MSTDQDRHDDPVDPEEEARAERLADEKADIDMEQRAVDEHIRRVRKDTAQRTAFLYGSTLLGER